MSTAIGTATNAVQAASVVRLRGDNTFMGMVQGLGVMDKASVPIGQALPYLTIGDAMETHADYMGTVLARGYECIMTLNAWSQARGFKTVQSIIARAILLLTDRTMPLVLPGQTHTGTWVLPTISLEDPDGVTQHAVARLLFRVREDL